GVGFHHDAWLRTTHTARPCPRQVDGQATVDQRHAALDDRRVLAEVPDVAIVVLGKPITRILQHRTTDLAGAVDLDAGDAQDGSRGAGHGELVVLETVLRLSLGDEGRARSQRKVRVVDGGRVGEVGRVDHGHVRRGAQTSAYAPAQSVLLPAAGLLVLGLCR